MPTLRSSVLKVWSAKFDWTGRVRAYMAHLAEEERLAIQGITHEKAVQWYEKHESLRREAWLEAEKAIALVRKARELGVS